MFKKYLFLIALSGCVLAYICSCDKSTKSKGPQNDPEAIEALINYYSSIFKVDIFNTSEDTVFYREIKKQEYYISIDIDDAPKDTIYTKIANVEFIDSIEGVFHLTLNSDEYQKDFKAVSKVKGYFEKWGDDFDDYRGWFLKGVAGNNIYSIPTISSSMFLNVESPSGEFVLSPTSIVALTYIRDVRTLGAGDSLNFKISQPDTSRLFYLHFWKDGNYQKVPFTRDGDTLRTACKISGSGYQHIFIDILDYNTVHDSTAGYKSYALGALFKVE